MRKRNKRSVKITSDKTRKGKYEMTGDGPHNRKYMPTQNRAK